MRKTVYTNYMIMADKTIEEINSTCYDKNNTEMRVIMPKDSQPDNKRARIKKADGQTPLTRENQNKSKTAKKQSNKQNDV